MSAPISEQPTHAISPLPENLFVGIFGLLDPLERSAPAVVSKLWNRLVTDRSLWPSDLDEFKFNVIDWFTWWDHASELVEDGSISYGRTQPFATSKDDIVTIMKVTRFYARLKAAGTSVAMNQGVTVLTIPQGLSINLLRKVFKDRIDKISELVLAKYGEEKVDKTYQVIITNSVLRFTRSKNIEEQRTLVKRAECVFPKVLEVLALALLTEKNTPDHTRLFNDIPWTYTRCLEVIQYEYEDTELPLQVGGFADIGLLVPGSIHLFDGFDVGAAGVAKF